MTETEGYFIKLFGERHSGTTVITMALRQHPKIRLMPKAPWPRPEIESELKKKLKKLPSPWDEIYLQAAEDEALAKRPPPYDWKHARPIWDAGYVAENAKFVFMLRNPYSWALAMTRTPYALLGPAPTTLADFVARPWMTLERERMPRILNSPLELWAKKLDAYFELETQAKLFGLSSILLRFEDMIGSVAEATERVFSEFGIEKLGISEVEHDVKKRSDMKALIEYYKHEKWKNNLTFRDVELINSYLDQDVLRRVGYEWLSPSDFPQRLEEKQAERLKKEFLGLDLTRA